MRNIRTKAGPYRFSVCICTRNRPDDLHKALRSLELSDIGVHEIIVSDDSTNLLTSRLVKSKFPYVKYVVGPKRGLSANRNNAIRAVTGTHLLFIDDDVEVAADFFGTIISELASKENMFGGKIIVTGLENKRGTIIYPHDQTFLGFQKRKYKDTDAIKTVVINSAVFPAALFNEVLFDEQLVYGYEEVDIATRAIRRGYRIVLAKDAVNYHYPSEINRDYYKPHIATSRLYVTFKRYLFTERNWLKAGCFLIAAFIHTMLHSMKAEGGRGIGSSLRTVGGSIKYIRTYTKQNRMAVRGKL
ncbi:glycosyltransferase family 2 protein [Paenibacillus piri]|uniref:Glycosyltransferase n=1 Tax=Paenibacillus piri TaxID=2547395 RepID=A0A4R5KWC1_9BACL|nr:glycosyltransferase [Paenibacillus piri]TDG00312.1 glycosyltransferase [Paenibacillus piri]